jgi:hypothetical protein
MSSGGWRAARDEESNPKNPAWDSPRGKAGQVEKQLDGRRSIGKHASEAGEEKQLRIALEPPGCRNRSTNIGAESTRSFSTVQGTQRNLR